MTKTHDVINQVPPLEDFNAYELDTVLATAVSREGADWATDKLRAFGAVTGGAELLESARLANTHTPILHTHDRAGHRLDEVEFHPSYHHLMKTGLAAGLHSLAWTADQPGGHVARIALNYMWPDAGTACPITMTHSVVPSLRLQPDVAAIWEPRALSSEYDGRFLPADQKTGATFGMAMTEKQGGSDVRSNSTKAVSLGNGEWSLTGHKWFCSAPMCDAFLTLAQTDKGLSCFLVPRFKPDGARNPFYVQRLKNKLGNRSNASSEVEYRDTWGQMVGEPGRGVATIIEMVAHTRLDVAIGAAGIMRHALVQAIHHCRHRSAFGKLLVDQPLMQNVLADLALEWEAATTLAVRVGRAFDRGANDDGERAFGRIAMSVAKYWCAKRVTGVVAEALECHGGNGYVEDAPMSRHYREAPLGSIWEGSGNVQCLDMLRAMRRTPESIDALFAEVVNERASCKPLDAHFRALQDDLANLDDLEYRARAVVERIAVGLQAALLVRSAPTHVADAFVTSRIGRAKGAEYGTLPVGVDARSIVDRAMPA